MQGVGFRPFVFRVASELGLVGWVLNDEQGVLIEAQGPQAATDELMRRLSADAPPLADVESVEATAAPLAEDVEFRIADSIGGGEPEALVSPDMATCEECLAELFDPADRRHRYPFINCTNCGPRFTIVRAVPYDRPLTTMAGFEMCDACRSEYSDPRDRRFHAQPNACPVCGPRVRLGDAEGDDAMAAATRLLDSGASTRREGARRLSPRLPRRRRDRGLGAALAQAARGQAVRADGPRSRRRARAGGADGPDEALLTGPERPIVIARRREGAPVADAVAPRTRDLGVMLPYTPLHHLLLADAATTLVMTSGNLSDEPIAYGDEDAAQRLGRDRGRLPGARPADPHAHGRLRRALARPRRRRTARS